MEDCRKSWRSAKTRVGKTIDAITAPIKSAETMMTESVDKAVNTVTAPISALETGIHESVDKVIGTATSPSKPRERK